MAPAPNRYHQTVVGNIYFLLRRYLSRKPEPEGALYIAPLDVFLTEQNVFQPDLVYVAEDRREVLREDGIVGAPTLVVEVLSAGTAQQDRLPKLRCYASAGVEELWLVDPETKVIEVYRPREAGDEPVGTHGGAHGQFRSACFPGLEIRLAEIF